MVLTAVTVTVAYLDLGVLNTVVALVIAVLKATLVILYFMHLRYSPSLTKLVVAGSFLWLAILLSITMADYVSRNW
jgi:cytochrome c oxidase subunit 4